MGIHNWVQVRELHGIEDHPMGRTTVRVLVRKCKWCNHREHHLSKEKQKTFHNWENFDDISENEKINFKRL